MVWTSKGKMVLDEPSVKYKVFSILNGLPVFWREYWIWTESVWELVWKATVKNLKCLRCVWDAFYSLTAYTVRTDLHVWIASHAFFGVPESMTI